MRVYIQSVPLASAVRASCRLIFMMVSMSFQLTVCGRECAVGRARVMM